MFHPTIYLQGRSVVVSGRVYVFGKTSAVDATIPTQNIVMNQDSTVFLHHVKTWGWRRYQTTYQSMATERKLNYLPFALLNTPHFMARRGNRHVSSPSPKKYLWVVFGIECPANPYMFSIQWDLMYLDRWTEGTVATKASLSLEYSSLPPALLTTCFLSSSEMEAFSRYQKSFRGAFNLASTLSQLLALGTEGHIIGDHLLPTLTLERLVELLQRREGTHELKRFELAP